MEYETHEGFARNKYFNWYDSIIKRATLQERTYDSSTHEKHHALPQCLGGTEVVILTFKEHYICHWLLTKFTSGNERYKMVVSMSFFYYNKQNIKSKRPLNAQKSRAYANFKAEFSSACQGRVQWTTSDVYTFKHMDTKETFTGTRHEFYLHKDKSVSHMEIWNLIHHGYINQGRWHSKRWGVWIDNLQKFSSEITRGYNGAGSMRVTCSGCGKTTNPGNLARWHKQCIDSS